MSVVVVVAAGSGGEMAAVDRERVGEGARRGAAGAGAEVVAGVVVGEVVADRLERAGEGETAGAKERVLPEESARDGLVVAAAADVGVGAAARAHQWGSVGASEQRGEQGANRTAGQEGGVTTPHGTPSREGQARRAAEEPHRQATPTQHHQAQSRTCEDAFMGTE